MSALKHYQQLRSLDIVSAVCVGAAVPGVAVNDLLLQGGLPFRSLLRSRGHIHVLIHACILGWSC